MLASQALPLSVAPVSVAQSGIPAVRIGIYDGPLEVLLFLVRREGVDVRDIPVARICDAYLAFLDESDVLDVDTVGDYLVMAATLCQLKARELLPREVREDAADEDDLDPREALARRLLEYERFRAAAEDLGALERLDRDVFARPAAPLEPDEQPIDPDCDAMGLVRLYYEVAERAAQPPPVHEIHPERYSISETVRWVLARLDGVEEMLLSELISELGGRARRIYAFLGVLEMARLRMLNLTQASHLGAVRLFPLVRAAEADLSLLAEAEDE